MPVAITATPQAVFPTRVLVTVTGLTVGDAIEVYRVQNGDRTLVRGGSSDAVIDTSFLKTDAELPYAVPVSYLAVVNGNDEYTTTDTSYTLSTTNFVISDAITGNAAEVVIRTWDEIDQARQYSMFKVGGRNVVVAGDLGMFEADIELYAATASARSDIMGVIENATEGIIQIRQPGTLDVDDAYVAVLGVTQRRVTRLGEKPQRFVMLKVAQVESWAPALEAHGFTYADLETAYTTSDTPLNANPYFETDVTSWTASGGATLARSTAQFHEGVASMLITPNGTTASPTAQSEEFAVVPSTKYQFSGWFRQTAAASRTLLVTWYNSAHVSVGTASVIASATTGSWVQALTTATSPATAAFARLSATVAGTPLATNTTYVDEIYLRVAPLTYVDLEADYATYLVLAQAEF